MIRRTLLAAAPVAVALAGAGVAPAAAAPLPSPILDAARQIATLSLQHDEADVPGAGYAEMNRIWRLIGSQEKIILAATPTTVAEAMAVLMVASGNLDEQDDLFCAAKSAAARAVRYLAGTAGVDVAEFGGDFYLPADVAPSCMGRAA